MYSLTLYTLIKVLNVFTKYCLGSADQGIHLKPCFSGECWRGILYHIAIQLVNMNIRVVQN